MPKSQKKHTFWEISMYFLVYLDFFRDRIELFRAKTNTKYSIIQTMLTTYGMADGVNSGIVQQEVVMDDLFNQ